MSLSGNVAVAPLRRGHPMGADAARGSVDPELDPHPCLAHVAPALLRDHPGACSQGTILELICESRSGSTSKAPADRDGKGQVGRRGS